MTGSKKTTKKKKNKKSEFDLENTAPSVKKDKDVPHQRPNVERMKSDLANKTYQDNKRGF